MHKNILDYKKHCKYLLFVFVAAAISANSNIRVESIGIPESTVSIEFEEGDAQIGPVDPDDPEIDGNGPGGGSGSLALNYVSHFFFDKQVISVYREEYPTITKRPYIQVTDLRGTGAGWEVTARASKFKNSDTGMDALLGSYLTFKDASCISATRDISSPIPKDPVVLPADGETTVKFVKASKGTGMGTWLTRWYMYPAPDTNYSVTLNVPPASGMTGENIAKITWILGDVPTD